MRIKVTKPNQNRPTSKCSREKNEKVFKNEISTKARLKRWWKDEAKNGLLMHQE